MSLVDRLKEKEEDALMELMNQYGDYLTRTAYLLLKDHQTAEEAVQDTFITAFEKIHQLDEVDKLRSWLTSIAINKCRAKMRKWSWRNIFLNLDVIERVKEQEIVSSPEEELLEIAWSHHVSKAIQQLDYKYREVITLYYFSELKISEIATYQHMKENTVKSRLKRARVLLKEILVKEEEVDEERQSIKNSAR